MKNTNKRGLFHPNDIKTLGIRAASPGPRTAPLPDSSTSSTRAKPSISPVSTKQPLPPSLGRSHSRSSSFAGSVGRAEARRLKSQSEFGKYTEEDDEDYEDVFGKVNNTGEFLIVDISSLWNANNTLF